MAFCVSCGGEHDGPGKQCDGCGLTPGRDNPYAPSDAVLVEDPAPRAQPHGNVANAYGIGFDLGSILGSTFTLWASTLPRMLVLGLIGQAAAITMTLFLAPALADGSANGYKGLLTTLGVAGGLLLCVGIPAMVFSQIGSILVVADQALYGRQTRSLGEVLKSVFPFFWRYLAAAVVIIAGMGALFLVASLFSGFLWVFGCVLFLGVVAVIFFYVTRWYVFGPVIVLEDRPAIESLGRSTQLVFGHWWGTFGIILVFGLILLASYFLVGLLSMIPVVGIGFQLVSGALTLPLGGSFCFALYAGLRSEDNVIDLSDTTGGWQS